MVWMARVRVVKSNSFLWNSDQIVQLAGFHSEAAIQSKNFFFEFESNSWQKTLMSIEIIRVQYIFGVRPLKPFILTLHLIQIQFVLNLKNQTEIKLLYIFLFLILRFTIKNRIWMRLEVIISVKRNYFASFWIPCKHCYAVYTQKLWVKDYKILVSVMDFVRFNTYFDNSLALDLINITLFPFLYPW